MKSLVAAVSAVSAGIYSFDGGSKAGDSAGGAAVVVSFQLSVSVGASMKSKAYWSSRASSLYLLL
jgi:hypothetical protein